MIQFTYTLQSAELAATSIGEGPEMESLSVSQASDALGDFVAALQSVFAVNEAECGWVLESGELEWHFQRQGSQVTVEALLFKDVRRSAADPDPALAFDRVVFSGRDYLLDFAVQVDRELQQLIDRW